MDPDRRIARIAEQQHGAFTRSQARACHASKQLIATRLRTRRWIRVHRRVYRIAGAPPTWALRLQCALLAAGDGAVASHSTAAALHGFEGFVEPDEIALTMQHGRRPDGLTHVRTYESRRLDDLDRTRVRGLPCTTVHRTLVDLAAALSEPRLEEVVEDALRQRLTAPAQLRDAAARVLGRGRPGSRAFKSLLRRRDPAQAPTESQLELRMERLMRRAKLPMPERQHRFRPGRRIDFAYPRLRIAIELDSDRWHTGPSRVRTSTRRQNELVLGGWIVLRYTWGDLDERPDVICDEIRRALRTRGALCYSSMVGEISKR